MTLCHDVTSLVCETSGARSRTALRISISMGKTSTERSRIRRAKLRQNPALAQTERDIDRLRKQRERANAELTINESKAAEIREKNRIRKRKQRQRERGGKTPPIPVPANKASASSGFKDKRSLSRVVNRLNKTLPPERLKAVSVLSSLVNSLSPVRKNQVIDRMAVMSRRKLLEDRKERSDALSAEDVKTVRQFYENDDVSRMCPGKKDVVVVRTLDGKEKMQKRIMIMNIAEAYQLFVADHLDVKIKLSKFSDIRPQHVRTLSEKDQEVINCNLILSIDYNRNPKNVKIAS